MNVTISGPRQSAADVFGAFRELVADLGDLVGKLFSLRWWFFENLVFEIILIVTCSYLITGLFFFEKVICKICFSNIHARGIYSSFL